METKSISDIKAELKDTEISALPLIIEKYKKDERAGVKTALSQALKKIEKYNAEMTRVEGMCYFEKKYAAFANICGIDEVGRGPLAGPVMAAAVILPKDLRIPYINDSKKLSASKREELYEIISEKALAIGLGMVNQERIDEINILQATYEAMHQAISHLKITPDYLLVDAVHIPKVDIPQAGIVKGDAKSISIAAASIIAKVTRDRIMTDYDKVYPEYGFAGNKGYGSAEHIEALKKYGPCPLHRKTFIKNFI